MKIERRTFRIGELAKQLHVEQFVIRFWEKEFGISAHRSEGGQRYYTDNDVEKFSYIKNLLYHERLTIEGAKKQLREPNIVASCATLLKPEIENHLTKQQLLALKNQLVRLSLLLGS